jgi:hypothetical protein
MGSSHKEVLSGGLIVFDSRTEEKRAEKGCGMWGYRLERLPVDVAGVRVPSHTLGIKLRPYKSKDSY